jgi:hypothetical protein
VGFADPARGWRGRRPGAGTFRASAKSGLLGVRETGA